MIVLKKEKKKSAVSKLLRYAGRYKALTFAGLALSAAAMVLGMLPYICIWLVARDLIDAAPDWSNASNISVYGWMAFAFAVGGIIVYFCALMCTHLAAFRTASNIRKQGMAHLMKVPLGFFDNNASGLLKLRSQNRQNIPAGGAADLVDHAVVNAAVLIRGKRPAQNQQSQFIVTEFGKVNLAGNTTWQFAENLISVADPDFRDELIASAEKMGIWRRSNKR